MFLFCTPLKTDFSLTYSYILFLSDTFIFIKNSLRLRLYFFRKNIERCYFLNPHISPQSLISLAIRRLPRGERSILPTFTPSGIHERLNC